MLISIFIIYVIVWADYFTTMACSNMGKNEIIDNTRDENDTVEEDSDMVVIKVVRKYLVWNHFVEDPMDLYLPVNIEKNY